jgi:hypothetical protein
MRDHELAAETAALARFFLGPPDEALAATWKDATGTRLDLAHARQDYYDYFCIPQSGCFIPPYAHVLTRSQDIEDFWHFPAPRHDGGDALLPWYDVAGFDPIKSALDPLLEGTTLPLDHIGFILAFLANLIDVADGPSDRDIVTEFLVEHVLPWTRLLPSLLLKADSPYVVGLGSALREWTDVVQAVYAVGSVQLPASTSEPLCNVEADALPCGASAGFAHALPQG